MKDKINNGLYGVLVGDALGVPYEFHQSDEIPEKEFIEFVPPKTFSRSYPDVPPGTWSDDGAQTLCLLDSLVENRGFSLPRFSDKLVDWWTQGHWAVDGKVFDCGIQTAASLQAYVGSTPSHQAGFIKPNGKGNGSLMRVLPIALYFYRADNAVLVEHAQRQSLITHGHPTNQVCCALYTLWAKNLMLGEKVQEAYQQAVSYLQQYYKGNHDFQNELYQITQIGTPTGTGYVVDSIRSALYLLTNNYTYEDVVKGAIALGNDTDTTAAIAGGLAGIAFGNIPLHWLEELRGTIKVNQLLQRLHLQKRRNTL